MHPHHHKSIYLLHQYVEHAAHAAILAPGYKVNINRVNNIKYKQLGVAIMHDGSIQCLSSIYGLWYPIPSQSKHRIAHPCIESQSVSQSVSESVHLQKNGALARNGFWDRKNEDERKMTFILFKIFPFLRIKLDFIFEITSAKS